VDTTIQEHKGNLLAVERGIIVHGCNALGSMGAGVAVAVRKQFPQAYEAYRERHQSSGLRLGDVISVIVGEDADRSARLIVANAITQEDCGREPGRVYVDYEAITKCFGLVRGLALHHGLPVHFPLIGCGLANGKWEEVAPRIEKALGPEVEKHLWVL
jgi:O-acetyl-ADP-ribose deacetylase (regulator of RNase III)